MAYRNDRRFFVPPQDEGLLVKIGVDLGTDTSMWLEKIRNAFMKRYPEFTSRSKPHFSFTYKDFANGAGVGGVTITLGSRILLFPIIIRNRALAPFDVFYDQVDQSWHYMTDDTERGLLDFHNPYKGLSSASFANYDRLDTSGERSYRDNWRDPAKVAGLSLAKMEDIGAALEADPDRYANVSDEFLNVVKEAAQAYARQKIAMKKQASIKRFAPGKYSSYDVALIRKEDIDTYAVKLGTYGRREITEQKLTSEGVRRLAADFGKLGTKILGDADRGPGALVTRGEETPTRIIDANLTDYIRNRPGQVASYGTYEVVLTTGRPAIGVVYPVMEWDGDDCGKMLFANNEVYSLTRPFSGRRSSENMVLPSGNLVPGNKGFYVKNSEGQAFCTRPFRIDRIYGDENARLQIEGTDISTMSRIHLVITDAFKSLTRINPDTAPELIVHDCENYYVPDNMRFVPLPEKEARILSSEASGSKIAELRAEMQRDPCSVLQISKQGSRYSLYQKDSLLRGEGVRDLESGDALKVAFVSAICGAGIDACDLHKMGHGERVELVVPPTAIFGRRINDAAEEARAHKIAEYNFSGRKEVFESYDEVIAPRVPPVSDMLKICAVLPRVNFSKVLPIVTAAWAYEKEGIHKAASSGDGKQSINKIFNLNLLSKENVGYFIEHLATMEVAEDVLTRLLIIARIGDIGLDPDMIKTVLAGLTEIKERFEHAKAVVKNR